MHRIALAVLCLLSPICAFAALTGPVEVSAGHIGTFTSDIPGDAVLFPAGNGALCKDSDGKTYYFATPTEGEYTLLCFGIRDGKPEIASFAFSVVAALSPTPSPNPNPNPEPAKQQLTPEQKQAVKDAAQRVLDGIAAGTLRTPQGARSAFKNHVINRVGSCNRNGCTMPEAVRRAVQEVEKSCDIQTLDGIQDFCRKVLEWK